jgi:4'-phosphopantetheinyl transferase
MRHTATVWLLDCRGIGDGELASFADWLGPSEAQRLTRFVRAGRRRQFVAGRALLRQSLGQLLGMPPAAVRLVEQRGNAPLLDLPDSAGVGFSLSHSGHWVACAVSATAKLGLDVELIDAARNIDELAAQAFDAEQQAWLAARPASDRVRDFYDLWSATEARYKLGMMAARECYVPHSELSITLCSARPLSHEPEVKLAMVTSDRSDFDKRTIAGLLPVALAMAFATREPADPYFKVGV